MVRFPKEMDDGGGQAAFSPAASPATHQGRDHDGDHQDVEDQCPHAEPREPLQQMSNFEWNIDRPTERRQHLGPSGAPKQPVSLDQAQRRIAGRAQRKQQETGVL